MMVVNFDQDYRRDNYAGRSLTAVTVAAHEVGHAHQDAKAYPPLRWRTGPAAW